MHRFLFSLRFRLILLVLIAIIPALGLTLYTGFEQRQVAATQAKEDALSLAHFVSSRQRQLVEGVHQFLHVLAQLPQVRCCDPDPCSRLFTDLLKQYPHYLNIGAIGLDGYVFASAIPLTKPIYAADRPYFRRALHTRKFTVGEYQIGRLTGKPGLNLGYPVMDDMGKVRAVVFVALDLSWLNQLSGEADLPKDSTTSLIDSDSTILARYPEPEKWVGKTMPEASIVKTILAQGEGMIETTGVDGVLRLYAFTSFGSTADEVDKIYVSVGIPASVAFAEVNRILARNLIFWGFIGLLALATAWVVGDLLVLRRVNPIVSAAKRLSMGDLSARTGITYRKGELSQLAFSFDQMAQSLEQREAEHGQMEKALHESQGYLEGLLNSIRAGILVIDAETHKIVDVNPYALEIIGVSKDQILGRVCQEYICPAEVGKCPLIELMVTVDCSERELIKANGERIPILKSVVPTIREDRKYLIESFIDITERKRAEEALRLEESRLETLLKLNQMTGAPLQDIMNFALEEAARLTGSKIGYLAFMNEDETVLTMHAWSKSAMEECRITDKPRIYPIETTGLWGEAVRQRKPIVTNDYTAPNLRKKGYPEGHVEITRHMNVPVFDGNRIVIVAGVGNKPSDYDESDVRQLTLLMTEMWRIIHRKRTEEEMAALQEQFRQSQKMEAIGQLAGGIAHDFNNLLTVIKGYSQLSLRELKETDPLSETLEEIKRAADRASDLTRQLLAFSRRQIMEMKVLDLNTVLQNLDKMLGRVIGEDIELVTLLAGDLGRVQTDPGQIEQVVMNLVVNAKDAMPKGGKLTVETANVDLDGAYARAHVAVKPGPYVMLSVSDTGVGMTPEVRERVFDPFFTTKEKGKGTGLGLSTVYGIVKQSGGNIWVYSEPGRGTTFKIYLPRVDEPLEEVAERVVKEGLPRGNETILIVEDNEEVRKLSTRVLERQGYKVLAARDGSEALLLFENQKEPFHLVLVDVVMPGLSGRQTVDQLRAVCKGFKVLYMSGYTENSIVHHGVLDKAMHYIQKPFTIDGLVRKVREVLEKDSSPAV